MSDYLAVACAVPVVRVGDVISNTERICESIRKADQAKCDLVLFPELVLTGYTCQDLFYQETLLESGKAGLQKIADCTRQHPGLTAIVGLPLVLDDLTFNCAAVLCDGAVRGIVPKTYIPDYNEFCEKRWFSSSRDLKRREISAAMLGLRGDYTVPAGRDLLFSVGDALVGVEICEDLWAPMPPSSFLALNGAQVIANLCASNEIAGKRTLRQDLVRHQSLACKCAYVLCSSGAGESTQDLVFSGHSLVGEDGKVTAESAAQADGGYLLPWDIDLGKIRALRRRNKTFADAAITYGQIPRQVICTAAPLRGDGSRRNPEKNPFLPTDEKKRREQCLEVFRLQAAGLKQRLSVRNAAAVLEVSGDPNSALAALVCVEAMRQLGRPASDVHAVAMPCFGTGETTCRNALRLMDILGVSKKEIPIAEAVTGHFWDIGHDVSLRDSTYENAQSRERAQVLMDYAGMVGGIVVGSCDLSELALGWCAYGGDHMSMYGVNCTVPKTMVAPMLRSIAGLPQFQAAGEVLADMAGVPLPPAPDAPGAGDQHTEALPDPWALYDFILYYAVGLGFRPKKIYDMACRAFGDDAASGTVKAWLKTFYRRFFEGQFVRSCMPDGVKTGIIGISPRGDLRIPSDVSARIWLDEACQL